MALGKVSRLNTTRAERRVEILSNRQSLSRAYKEWWRHLYIVNSSGSPKATRTQGKEGLAKGLIAYMREGSERKYKWAWLVRILREDKRYCVGMSAERKKRLKLAVRFSPCVHRGLACSRQKCTHNYSWKFCFYHSVAVGLSRYGVPVSEYKILIEWGLVLQTFHTCTKFGFVSCKKNRVHDSEIDFPLHRYSGKRRSIVTFITSLVWFYRLYIGHYWFSVFVENSIVGLLSLSGSRSRCIGQCLPLFIAKTVVIYVRHVLTVPWKRTITSAFVTICFTLK